MYVYLLFIYNEIEKVMLEFVYVLSCDIFKNVDIF